jgi:hypothetical protein
MIDLDRLYPLSEAKPYTGRSRTSLYAAIAAGQLIAVKVGRRTYLRGRDIAKYAADLPKLRETV